MYRPDTAQIYVCNFYTSSHILTACTQGVTFRVSRASVML